MSDLRNIKPLRGSFELQDSKVSIDFEFASEADAEAAFRAMTAAARAGCLNIMTGLPPMRKAQESRG